MATKQATKAQAEAVIDELMRVFQAQEFGWTRPKVDVNGWEHGRTVFHWEEGPCDWYHLFPYGGLDEFGNEWPAANLPKDVWIEQYDPGTTSVWFG